MQIDAGSSLVSCNLQITLVIKLDKTYRQTDLVPFRQKIVSLLGMKRKIINFSLTNYVSAFFTQTRRVKVAFNFQAISVL